MRNDDADTVDARTSYFLFLSHLSKGNLKKAWKNLGEYHDTFEAHQRRVHEGWHREGEYVLTDYSSIRRAVDYMLGELLSASLKKIENSPEINQELIEAFDTADSCITFSKRKGYLDAETLGSARQKMELHEKKLF